MQNDWWDCLWLNEGFASYWTNVAFSALAPAFVADGSWRMSTQGVMADDGYAASQALTVNWPLVTQGEADGVFSGITYSKGSAIIAGISRRMEAARPGSFVKGLQSYLARYAYGSTKPLDLMGELAAASTLSNLVAEFNAPLFLPGVPLLRVEEAAGGTSVSLTATRYFVCPESESAAIAAGQSIAAWAAIPLAISAQTPSSALAMAAAEAAAALSGPIGGTALPATLPYDAKSDGWLIVTNSSAADYVRVLYPISSYAALSTALAGGAPAPALGTGVRAALVDDLFSAAEARVAWQSRNPSNFVNMTFVLNWIATWMPSESNGYVLSTLSTHLRRLKQLLVDDVPFVRCGMHHMPKSSNHGDT